MQLYSAHDSTASLQHMTRMELYCTWWIAMVETQHMTRMQLYNAHAIIAMATLARWVGHSFFVCSLAMRPRRASSPLHVWSTQPTFRCLQHHFGFVLLHCLLGALPRMLLQASKGNERNTICDANTCVTMIGGFAPYTWLENNVRVLPRHEHVDHMQ